MEVDIGSYGLKIGGNAIGFSLKGVDDKIHSPGDFKGKIVAVIFTCNHCPYARAYEERIVNLQKEFSEKAYFLAVNSNDPLNYPQDSFDNMKIRAREKNFNFPYLHDTTQETARAYGAQVTPEIFLFNTELKLAYHGSVDNNTDNPKSATPYFRMAIQALLAGKEPEVKETKAFGCTIKWK